MTLFKPYQVKHLPLVFTLLAVVLAGLVTAQSQAAESEIESAALMMKKKAMAAGTNTDFGDELACNPNGIALAGIDVVSYHKPTGPLIGNREFTALHDGLTYRFVSEQHLNLFVDAPQTYLPHYQGWCATSLAAGALTCPNPLNYKLENGKLLLFETTGFTNGQNIWNADPSHFRSRADMNRDNFLSGAIEQPETPNTSKS